MIFQLMFLACQIGSGQDFFAKSSLLKDAVGGWDFSERFIKSALSGKPDGKATWGAWQRNTVFGYVLDLSCPGSRAISGPISRPLGRHFTLSAWIKFRPGQTSSRAILSQGTDSNYWCLELSSDGFLVFRSPHQGVSLSSRFKVAAVGWRHVMASYREGKMDFFVDGVKRGSAHSASLSLNETGPIIFGSNPDGKNGLTGAIAEPRVYASSKVPPEVTAHKSVHAENGARMPIVLKHGIAFDRRQFEAFPTPEVMQIQPRDIVNCRQMGFDHAKILFSPEQLITAEGHVNEKLLPEFKEIVDIVIKGGLNCIVCIHPGDAFKKKYLGDLAAFESLIQWYGELAGYVGKHWPANRVAFQLMTEPYANTDKVTWDWMSDRMIAAARNAMPNHTIITSSDHAGNLESIKTMIPVVDPNVIYTFTTYEPYFAGFNIIFANGGPSGYLRNIPYPGTPTNVSESRIDDVLASVPADKKEPLRNILINYSQGKFDEYDWRTNKYGGYYDQSWHMARAKSLHDWSDRFGGVNLMCVEFGCYYAKNPLAPGPNGPSPSITLKDRAQLIGDLRRSFDAYNIGWDYWSYNDTFSVYDMNKRIPGFSPDAEKQGPSWYDLPLLTEALGLIPRR